MFGFFGLEVEIERDERPVAMIAFFESTFDYGADTIEEVVLHGGLVATDRRAVGNDGPGFTGLCVGVPVEILLDRERCTGRERTVNSVVPPFVIRITIVRIHHGAASGKRLVAGPMLRAAVETRCMREVLGRVRDASTSFL